MAKIQTDQPLLPSVLDRLLDDDPAASRDPPRNRYQVMRELKLSVRRDLEHLLNTRRQPRPLPPGLDELERSLIAYGAPDVTGSGFGSSRGAERFRATLEEVIAQWEPRFARVGVSLIERGDGERTDRTLHFRIDALLKTDPAPEPVVFDSTFEPATGSVEVRGGT
jgi:type VI secretion system protein ImpF